MLAAFAATGEQRFLNRAETLAWNITRRQAAHGDGMIWEHYRADWTPDWDYNRDDPANLFRPWSYQPGHFTEWAKLLLQLERHEDRLARGGHWLLPTAQELFEQAIGHAWDWSTAASTTASHRTAASATATSISGCRPSRWPRPRCWPTAPAIPATGTGTSRIWEYAWEHFVDHEHGAWYRILTADNRKISDEKSPAGKTDYHTMGACYDVVPLLERRLARVGK
jgi:mannose/cellobiose epimerase-like protein (N-acyl-D-glucosamine 2-epimerase family)